MKTILATIAFFLSAISVSAQDDVFDIGLTEIMISHNQSEHDRQVTVKNNQAAWLVTQTIAKQQADSFKTKVTRIHKQFQNTMALISDVATLADVANITKNIYDNETKIITLTQQAPYYAPLVIEAEAKLIKKATRIIQMITAFVAVGSDLTQMKEADRRTIFQYAVGKFRFINDQLSTLVKTISVHISLNTQQMQVWKNYINIDKKLFDRVDAQMKKPY